jgi:WD40 repeat protein
VAAYHSPRESISPSCNPCFFFDLPDQAQFSHKSAAEHLHNPVAGSIFAALQRGFENETAGGNVVKKIVIHTRLLVLVFVALIGAVSCGGGGASRNPVVAPPVVTPPIAVSISPASANLESGNQFTFVANVTGTTNTAVTWSVQEGAAGGSITSAGVYTAPASDGIFQVIARSQADPTRQAKAMVTVAPIEVSIQPESDVLGPHGVRSFTSSVSTSLNPAVIWSLQEGALGGAITADGTYTAPSSTGEFHVIATSVQNPVRSAIANVTVVANGFRRTADMSVGRTAPTATLLPNGKVLITGGDSCFLFSYYTGECPLASTELYDPVTETTAPAASMSVTRSFHTATLLNNGKVLVVGGWASSTSELYDPATNTFTNSGNTSVIRDSHTATLLPNGKVLIAGGVTGQFGASTASAELYDPATGTFSPTGNMAAPRFSHTATLLADGTVLITGGLNNTPSSQATAELYDPATGTFTLTGQMKYRRVFHTATLLNSGKVLITGGSGTRFEQEIFDPTNGTFSVTGSMSTPRAVHIAVRLLDGRVLVAGEDFTAETYDPVTGTFTQTGSMESARAFSAAVLLQDGRVFVCGGSDSKSVEIYE